MSNEAPERLFGVFLRRGDDNEWPLYDTPFGQYHHAKMLEVEYIRLDSIDRESLVDEIAEFLDRNHPGMHGGPGEEARDGIKRILDEALGGENDE